MLIPGSTVIEESEREREKNAKMIWVPGHTQEATCLGLSGGVAGGARQGFKKPSGNES